MSKMLLSSVRLVAVKRLSYGCTSTLEMLACASKGTGLFTNSWFHTSATGRVTDHMVPDRRRSVFDGTVQSSGLMKTAVRNQHQKTGEKLTSAIGDRTEVGGNGKSESKDFEKVKTSEVKLSQKERLKRAVREYGATVIVFHTTISLFTLGVSYAVVSSGIDVVGLMSKIGIGQSILESKLATGASTFVVAYAVHKVFAPARMACTLTATPFIVRYLRKIGFLKAPVPKS